MNHARNSFFFICLILFTLISLPLVSAASSSDFVKLQDGDVTYFTHKDLINSRYLVGSDKIFYGSKEGEITLKLYLKDKLASGDYKFGLRTKSKNITIKSVGVGKAPSPILSVASSSYNYPSIIALDNSLTEVTIVIEFDPTEIGLLEEFDIILYNDKDEILVTYDPFLSGYSFRQPLTLNTDGIGLGGDITNDHSILVYVDPTNTDFWTGDTLGTGNGITFTQSDELTELDYDLEAFNNGDNNAWFWVEETETFTSGSDLNMWFYYGGVDVDNSDGSGAYPSGYSAVFHLNETSSTYQDATVGGNNETAANVTQGLGGNINLGADFNGTNTFVSFGNTLGDVGTGEFTYLTWVNTTTTGIHQHLMGARDEASDTTWVRMYINIVAGKTQLEFGSGTSAVLTTTVANTGWRMITGVRRSGNAIAISLDATQEASATNGADGTSSSNAVFNIGATSDLANDLVGRLDDVKVFDYGLSADEITLLFNSESDNLITFGSQEIIFLASFTVSGSGGLDPENSILSVDRNFTNTSIPIDANFFWSVDGVQESTDINFTKSFTSVGDFNISLLMDSAGNELQQDQNISIIQLPQAMDLNFSYNAFTTANADVNYGVTFTGSADSFNWGFPGDNNVFTRNAQKTYTTSGQKTVCLTTTTSDANKTVCENFFVGRVLVRIPKDLDSSASLSPFDFTATTFPFQSYVGLNADTNVFVFNETTNFDSLVSVDFNSDYFGTSQTFTFNSFFHDYQAYLVENDGINLEATIFTINNPKGRVTVSGIRIDSFTDVNGVSTLVESKFSDGTGQAIVHFVKGDEYTLIFFDSDGVLLMSQTIEANNTNYFAYLELGLLDLTPTTFLTVAVDWNPLLGNVVPDVDGNVSFWQLLRPQNGTIGDVNVFISHISDLNIIYNQVFTVNSSSDFNLSFDLNVAGFNNSFPLKLSLQIFDDNSVQVGSIRTNSYGFKDTGFKETVEGAKDALGQFGVTLISLIITVIIVGFYTSKAIAEDTNLPALALTFLVTLLFVLIGWIPGDAFASGLLFGVGMGIWGLKK